MLTMWKLYLFILCSGLITDLSLQEGIATRPISDVIKKIPSSDFTLSKDWALKFDEEMGRGDYMTEDKELEIHNNLLEVAEMLHIIPEGTASRYSSLILREGVGGGTDGITEISTLDDSDLTVSIPLLRLHGITTFRDSSYHAHSNKGGHHNPDQSKVSFHSPTEPENLRVRKYSPRLTMYSKQGVPF